MSVSHQLHLFFDQASNDCSSRLAGPIRCAHLIIKISGKRRVHESQEEHTAAERADMNNVCAGLQDVLDDAVAKRASTSDVSRG